MDERTEEILARLDAIEHRLDALERAGPRCSFCEEERRIVDTIVRLTTESVVGAMEERMTRRQRGPGPPDPPRGHDYDHGPRRPGPR